MASTVLSRAGVPIRLTDERWSHVVAEHPELALLHEEVLMTIAAADRVVAAVDGARMAVRTMESPKTLVVVYRELGMNDGFVITAYLTKRIATLDRRPQPWPPKN